MHFQIIKLVSLISLKVLQLALLLLPQSLSLQVRSNHQRLINFSSNQNSEDDRYKIQDSPLKLKSTSNWLHKGNVNGLHSEYTAFFPKASLHSCSFLI